MRFSKKTLLLVSIPLLILITYLYIHITSSRFATTNNAYVKTGISNISPQISAVITKVYIKNNQKVKLGDLLISLDKAELLINLEAAKANLTNATNSIRSLKSAYYAKFSDLESAKADLTYYQNKYDRFKDLQYNNAISKSELDEAVKMLKNSSENINNSKEKMNQQLAQLDGNIDLNIEEYSLYKQAKAQIDQAQLNLTNADIRAMSDGIIANLYVNPGSFANVGIPLFSVIDDNNIWLEANFKETELTDIKAGQKATVNIDSFPKSSINAVVESITRATGSEFAILPAQNSSGNWVKVTQRIMVKLKFADKLNLPLSSGMSANVIIDTRK